MKEEAAALREVTLFGYPLKSWFCSADLDDGALPVLMPGVKMQDPGILKIIGKYRDIWGRIRMEMR